MTLIENIQFLQKHLRSSNFKWTMNHELPDKKPLVLNYDILGININIISIDKHRVSTFNQQYDQQTNHKSFQKQLFKYLSTLFYSFAS